MSRKKLFVIIVAIILIALAISLMLIHFGLADPLHDGLVEYGGPVGTWVVDTYNGIATSSFCQTYFAPPWNAFGIGFVICGIIALVLWKKAPSIHWPRKAVTPSLGTSMEFQREPAEPETAPKPRTTPEPSPTTEEGST